MIELKKTGSCRNCPDISLSLHEWQDGYGRTHHDVECTNEQQCKAEEAHGMKTADRR